MVTMEIIMTKYTQRATNASAFTSAQIPLTILMTLELRATNGIWKSMTNVRETLLTVLTLLIGKYGCSLSLFVFGSRLFEKEKYPAYKQSLI